MSLPGPRDWVFSVKAFAGAMLALWIAFRLGLDRPYWAMASAYIVAQPLTGAMRSKAAYRFCGTMLGAVMTLVLLPNLRDAPEVLTALLALWVAACIYFAVLDRTPRSYLFLLAGYSVALIGFPSVDTPDGIWDIVVARVEEICLGIVCTTMIGSLVLPAAVGPALTRRLDAWVGDAANWVTGVLSGGPDDEQTATLRRKIAADAVEIEMLASHLAYDTSNLQVATLPVALLRERVVLLFPVVSGIAERIAGLAACGGMTPRLDALLRRMAAWIGCIHEADLAEAERLRGEIAAQAPAIDGLSGWDVMTRSGLLIRLGELIDLVHDIRALRLGIEAERTRLPPLAWQGGGSAGMRTHHDHTMALYSAFAAVLAVGLLAAFWIASAWPEGGGGVALAAVACAFFAAQDDPVPSIVGFVWGTLAALLIDAVYLFAVLPRVGDFATLVAVLAPVFLVLGGLTSMPATARRAGPISFIASTELALANGYGADFASYLNGSIAAVVGLCATATILGIVRSVSAEWTAGRLLRHNQADIVRVALGEDAGSRAAFAGLQLDRLSMIVPRLAANADRTGIAMAALANLRVGVNVVDLRSALADLPEPARDAVASMLDTLAAHYRRHADRPGSAALLHAIDRALAAVSRQPGAGTRSVLLHIAGIRRALFHDSRPYTPVLAAGSAVAGPHS